MRWFDVALRAATVSQLIFIATLFIRAGWPPSLQRLIALLLAAGVVAYLFCSAPELSLHGFVYIPVIVLCVGCPVFFWWFSAAVFEDSFQLRVKHWAALALIVGLGMAANRTHVSLSFFGDAAFLRIAQRVMGMGFVLLGLWVALRDRANDLLESRRRFRYWFTLLVGLQMVIIVSAELALRGEQPPIHIGILNVATILVITHVTAHALVRVRGQLFDTLPREAADPDEPSAKDGALLDRLRLATEQERVYRQEGLTIAQLAQQLGTQEHALRRTINQGLGFRNFNEFLNSYRVREAAERLRLAENRTLPVLTIALEAGYGSIGPFNRAFKELMGMTPTEYRATGRTVSTVSEEPSA